MPGPRNMLQIIGKRLKLQGFIVLDHFHRYPEFLAAIAPALRAGTIVAPERWSRAASSRAGRLRRHAARRKVSRQGSRSRRSRRHRAVTEPRERTIRWHDPLALAEPATQLERPRSAAARALDRYAAADHVAHEHPADGGRGRTRRVRRRARRRALQSDRFRARRLRDDDHGFGSGLFRALRIAAGRPAIRRRTCRFASYAA